VELNRRSWRCRSALLHALADTLVELEQHQRAEPIPIEPIAELDRWREIMSRWGGP
jgi:hypothetical protein